MKSKNRKSYVIVYNSYKPVFVCLNLHSRSCSHSRSPCAQFFCNSTETELSCLWLPTKRNARFDWLESTCSPTLLCERARAATRSWHDENNRFLDRPSTTTLCHSVARRATLYSVILSFHRFANNLASLDIYSPPRCRHRLTSLGLIKSTLFN